MQSTCYSIDLTGVSSGGWADFTARETWQLAALTIPPNNQTIVRVRFTAGSSGWDIAEAWIGNRSAAGGADDWDFASSPTRLTFNSGSNTTSLAARASISTDWVSFPFVKTGGGIVISNYTAVATNDTQGQNNRSSFQGNWFKAGNDASTVDATGYSSGLGTVGVASIEMDGFGDMPRLVRVQSWYQGPWR